jgi:membrane fusion protein (multidrug efflux system)
MTRNRVVTVVALVGLAAGGLTVLMAAREPGEKPAPPAKPQAASLVCLGTVDTEEKMTSIFPDNFPQPSRVVKVLVREGEEVKKGQTLLELDRQFYDLKVGEAETAIKAFEAELRKAQAVIRAHREGIKVYELELEAKQAELDARKEELEQTKEAVAGLRKSKVDLLLPQANVTAAEKALAAVRLKLETQKIEVPTYLEDLANAGVAQKKELKKQAELARDLATCTAPADGRIVRSFVAEGSQFGPTMSREPAFWFVKKGPLIVRAEVTQEFAGRMSDGQPAEIEDESDASQRWTGRVTKVGEQFLPKRHANGNALDIFPVNTDPVLECLVSIDLAGGQAAPKFGQKVRVTIPKK